MFARTSASRVELRVKAITHLYVALAADHGLVFSPIQASQTLACSNAWRYFPAVMKGTCYSRADLI